MAGTNREEMRKLLNTYIALMLIANENGINFEIDTRLKVEDDRPWFTGRACEEGCDFTDETQRGVRYLYFVCYEWRSVEKNEEQLKAVEKFVEDHKK